LRDDHARGRHICLRRRRRCCRLRCNRGGWCGSRRRCYRRDRRRRECGRRRIGRHNRTLRNRCGCRRRCSCGRLNHGRSRRGKCWPNRRRWNHDLRRYGSWSDCGSFGCWRGGRWLGLRGRGNDSRTSRRNYARGSLLLADGIQNVAGAGNARQIDLGLNLVSLGAAGASVFGRGLRFAGGAEVHPQFCRLMLFHGTGVRFLLRHPYFCKRVEDRLAFDFQFPGQIVNSNLAHPLFLSLRTIPLSLHINLTVSFSVPRFCYSGKRVKITLFPRRKHSPPRVLRPLR
jgi:hypothetical protein